MPRGRGGRTLGELVRLGLAFRLHVTLVCLHGLQLGSEGREGRERGETNVEADGRGQARTSKPAAGGQAGRVRLGLVQQTERTDLRR